MEKIIKYMFLIFILKLLFKVSVSTQNRMYIKLPNLNAVKIKETICFSFSFMQKR